MAVGQTEGLANRNAVGVANEYAPADANQAMAAGREEGVENTVEFRVMMAYATRRRPGAAAPPSEVVSEFQQGGTPKTPAASLTEQRRRKKKKRKMGGFLRLLSCVSKNVDPEEEGPQMQDGSLMFRGHGQGRDGEGEENGGSDTKRLEDVATRLTKMADAINFTAGDLEMDGEKDSVETLVGLLLREHGDKLNDEILKDESLAKELLGSYGFFSNVISTFLTRIEFNPNPSTEEPKAQIAVTCEVASRLSVLDTLPMNRVLGFGAKFLKDHYSPWVMQKGGYEEVFEGKDDTNEEEA